MSLESWKADVLMLIEKHLFMTENDLGWTEEDWFNYHKQGDTPDDFVVWYANKYDLYFSPDGSVNYI